MRMSRILQLAFLLCACLSPGLAQPNLTCASCHQAEASTQPGTDMGSAMLLPGHNQALTLHPDLTFQRGAYQYSVKTHNGETKYIVSDGKQSISIPVLWSIGTPAQTWMLEYDGQMYSSMVSYYPENSSLYVTLGDETLHPASLKDAIGRPLNKEGVMTCFDCHSTHAVIQGKLNLATLQPGVGCEHCHIGAAAHMAAISKGSLRNLPPDLSKLSSEDLSNFCGQCHRSFSTVVRRGWRGTNNVRFQPYRLALSKCFSGTDPRISCIACHNPHVEVVRNSVYYDKKCLACHSPAMSKAAPFAKICPVSKSHCVSCHMPKVTYPGGHFVYYDHDIRLVKKNGAYPY